MFSFLIRLWVSQVQKAVTPYLFCRSKTIKAVSAYLNRYCLLALQIRIGISLVTAVVNIVIAADKHVDVLVHDQMTDTLVGHCYQHIQIYRIVGLA